MERPCADIGVHVVECKDKVTERGCVHQTIEEVDALAPHDGFLVSEAPPKRGQCGTARRQADTPSPSAGRRAPRAERPIRRSRWERGHDAYVADGKPLRSNGATDFALVPPSHSGQCSRKERSKSVHDGIGLLDGQTGTRPIAVPPVGNVPATCMWTCGTDWCAATPLFCHTAMPSGSNAARMALAARIVVRMTADASELVSSNSVSRCSIGTTSTCP